MQSFEDTFMKIFESHKDGIQYTSEEAHILFNSRVSKMSDFIIYDDDKHTPVPDTYISDEYEHLSARHNEDTIINEYGKHLLTL